ncbi:MAG: tRNA lysidine(34) synthetase TilS [Dorea sp.]|jgi:tRNA(Ile)-lysidine synthase|nr:tRNA lysidine(34) synthetase TilS [Dorea sp.]
MYRKVREYIRTWQMLGREDKVIAGISGGADSICLLFILVKIKEEMGFELAAVHIHHGLRGETADRDEAYVRSVCESENVELFVYHKDVKQYAKEHGLTEEEAGREVRRDCFMEVMEEQNGTCIATAHHRNDNAETVLWNLCRGTGLKGMGGISPKNGVWIRPLLNQERTDIESYLKKRGISYCTDETNLQDCYTRNRIRNHVLTYLEENINEKSVVHITECAAKLRKLGEYIEEETTRYRKICTEKREDGTIVIVKKQYELAPDALKAEIVHEIICKAAGRKKDIEEIHVKTVQELMRRQVGRKADLPYGLEAVRNYEGICLGKKEKAGQREEKPLFRMRIFEKSKEYITFSQKNYTKWFDYAIISNTVKIRHRKPGDYIVIDKEGRKQKLKQYFINAKIPRESRDSIWLAADGNEIMWIVGYRQSQAYQITDSTKQVLEISFYGGEDDGGDNKSIGSRSGGCKED